MTFEELFYMAEGQNKKMVEEYKNTWEQTRWLGFLTILPHLGKGSKIRKATDLIRFSWEKKKKKAVDWAKIRELEKLFEFEGKKIKNGTR